MLNSDETKRIKDKFRTDIAGVIVHHLGPYRKDSCRIGRITNNEDFKHLAKKVNDRSQMDIENAILYKLKISFSVDTLCNAERVETL